MNLWNIRNLPMPPINTYKSENMNIDIKYLGKVLGEGKAFFEDENYMKAEQAVLLTIVYRSKQKFRTAKDFKSLEKVSKALGIYFKSNILYDLKCFMNLIPTKYAVETYLPTKNLLDYILVRLQGLVKLLERIVETCQITAHLFDQRMHTGHFWKLGFIIFSSVSRIYVLAKHSAKFICDFYNKIVPFSRRLKNNGRDWLPEDYILPNDLQQWMNVDWLNIDDEVQIIETYEILDITQFFDLVDDGDDDDIQFCDEYIMVDDEKDVGLVNEFRNPSDGNKQDIYKLRGFDFGEDVGELIEVNDDSLLNSGDMLPEKTENDIHIISDSSLLSDEVGGSSSADSEGIIEIDDTVHIPVHKSFTQRSNESNNNDIITLDDSSVSNENANSFDLGKVSELSSNSRISIENTFAQSEVNLNDTSSESIIFLDNSSISKSQNANCVTDPLRLSLSKGNALETHIDPVCLANDSQVMPHCVKGKRQTKKERAIKNKQKKSNKRNEGIYTNQLSKEFLENTAVLSKSSLNKKICVSANSTPKFKAKKNVLSHRKNIIVVSDSPLTQKDAERSLLINKTKNGTKTGKNIEQKQKFLQNTTQVTALGSVKDISENQCNKNIENKKKKKRKSANSIMPDVTLDLKKIKRAETGHRDNFSLVANSCNVKKQKVATKSLALKRDRKKKTNVSARNMNKSNGEITKRNTLKKDTDLEIYRKVRGVHKANNGQKKKLKKSLKKLGNALPQQNNTLKDNVNKIHFNAQGLNTSLKTKKKKNRRKKNKTTKKIVL